MKDETRKPLPENGRENGVVCERERKLAGAVAEYLDRQASGQTVDIEDFCNSYPELAPDLRCELEALTQIDPMAPGQMALSGEDRGADLPERLSGHKVLGEIGSGGMGRVLLAFDEGLRRNVAIKVLGRRFHENVSIRTRFMKEAQAMARLSHPNIVRIYHLGQPNEQPHFVMEHLEGVPLTEAAKPLTHNQKVELMRKVVLAVEFLHEHGIIHRDLKPGNILVGAGPGAEASRFWPGPSGR